jgi:hypothetical protein
LCGRDLVKTVDGYCSDKQRTSQSEEGTPFTATTTVSNNSPTTLPQLRNILRSVATDISTLDLQQSTTAQDREELKQILTQFLAKPSINKFTAPLIQAPSHQNDEISETKSTRRQTHKVKVGPHRRAKVTEFFLRLVRRDLRVTE